MYTHRSEIVSPKNFSGLVEKQQKQFQLYSTLLLDCLMAVIAIVLKEYNTNLSVTRINSNDTATENQSKIEESPMSHIVVHASDVNLRSYFSLIGLSGLESTNSYEIDLVFLDKLLDTGVKSDSDGSINRNTNGKGRIGMNGINMEEKGGEKLFLQHGNYLPIDDNLFEKNMNLFLLAGQSNMSGIYLNMYIYMYIYVCI
jgi:hypothetical protein